MLDEAGFGTKKKKATGINFSASILGSGAGIGYTAENDNKLFDIGVKIEEMLKTVQSKNAKILIGMDEIYKSEETVMFASEYGKWLRAGYPVYFVCIGLYENIQELSNVKILLSLKGLRLLKQNH